MFKKFSHLGIAVADVKDAITRYKHLFGLSVMADPGPGLPGAKAARMAVEGSYVEFLQPTVGSEHPDGGVARQLEEKGEGVYYIGFTVQDVAGKVQYLSSRGVGIIECGGSRRVFIDPKSAHGAMIELVDERNALAPGLKGGDGLLKRFDHLGLGVKDGEAAASVFGNVLGLPRIPWQTKTGGVRIAKFSVGEDFLALIQPAPGEAQSWSNTHLSGFIREKGEGVYQVCYVVDNVKQALKTLASRGADVIPGEKMSSVSGAKLGFVQTQSACGVFLEMVEK